MTDVSYGAVRAYVAKRLPEIAVEHGRGEPGAFVPQTHLPGREAEVDFAEITVRLRGELVTCHLFALRMSYSARPFIARLLLAVRKHSSRATFTRSKPSAGCPPERSATTTSKLPSPR